MTRLNQNNLSILRQKPQSAHLYMSIFQPRIIFQAQINDATITLGARVITFNNVSLGLYTYIQPNFTMWIGSTPGTNDIGKIRVRSATSTQITVSENNNIPWANGKYITIFNYVELWPIYPRIIADPANQENTIWYKDYDISYTNQNSILGTFVNAGPHRALLLDPASSSGQIYYSSTGSYNLLGDSLNYDWFFEGATVTGSSSAVPGYITYNTPGHYVTRLIISGSSGEIDTTYRYVSIYNQANPPIQKWQLNSLQGSRDEGGYSASIKVFEIIPIQEHAVVVLFGDSFYGATHQNIGGNFPNSSDIFMVGYVDKDSIQYDYQHSEVSFNITSLTDAMKKSSGFSVSVQSVASPSKWYELLDMDSRRALYHYLRWHTTAMNIADFQFVGDDYKVQFFDSDRESMYDAINNYMQNSLVGNTVSDRQGKIWMEVEAMAYPNPTGTFTPVMDITKNDWMNTPSIEERLTPDVSYMEYGGVHYSGVVTGTFNPLMSAAPGNAPGFYGSMDSHQGLVLGGQPQLNQMMANIFSNKNSQYPTIGLDMSVNASNLDIAPQETIEVHISAQDTVRNVTINGLYIPDSFSWKYDPRGYQLFPQIDFKQLVNGNTAQTITIPAVADVGGGFEFDPYSLDFPPLPNSFPPTSSDTGDGGPAKVIVHDQTAGLLFTNTFNTLSPQWFQVNGGLTQSQYQAIDKILVCPNGAVYVACNQHNNTGFLARAPYAGGGFTIIEDYTSMTAKMSSTDNVGLVGLGYNKEVAESVLYAIGKGSSDIKTYLGSGNTFVAKVSFAKSTNGGWSLTYGVGQWVHTSDGVASLLGANADSVSSSISIGADMNSHVRAGATAKTVHWGSQKVRVCLNNCASVSSEISEPSMSSNGYFKIEIIDIDTSGIYLMGGGGTGVPYKSSDGGYSWSAIGTLSVAQNDWRPCNTGEASKWILISTYIYYTDDFGNTTWKDKRGNILTISPILFLDAIKVVP